MRKLRNEELQRLSPEEFKAAEKLPVVVVLDNVRSLHNVGSVFRTCDAFRIHGLYLCGITGKPPDREITKTALGATETVQWTHFPKTSEALDQLKSAGYRVYAIEQAEGAIALHAFTRKENEKLALVFGNEVKGVDQEVINACDGVIEIPQGGTKHSLNIAVSAGIVCWELFRNAPH
jgi:23S rRNA (guanosine2251-2'-O)-methyltransferase